MAEHEEGTTPEAAPPTLTPSQVSGRTFRRYNLAALACGAAALAAGAPWALSGEGAQVAAHDPLGFARDARWDDGKAEVARYTAQRTIYGSPRDFELIRIAVKEPFDPAQRVKPDADRPGVLSAIKTVAVHEVPCGRAYTYRQQLICRLAQADPRRLLDATSSSQEWCGSTFVVLARKGAGFAREAHSYWDGQGDWADRIEGELWLEDQLAFTLRGLDPERAPGKVRLLPSILSNKAPATQPLEATIECKARGEEQVVPAGSFRCAHWVVTVGGQTRDYWVSEEGARPLVAFDDGVTRGQLRSLERAAYWVGR
ncbi:MAG: hypothetical protein KDD82_06330 [Planctomycetes bacterium]|nr:hypothetical protein [Planctomycetota bacterium]